MSNTNGAGRRLTIRSVRVRATLAVVIVVAAVTSVGAVVFLSVLRGLLTEELSDATRTRAEHIAATLHLDAPGLGLAQGDLEDEAAQLVRSSGLLVAATSNIAALPPLVWPAPSDFVEIDGAVDAEQSMIVVAHHLDDDLVLLVGKTTESREDAIRHVTELLAVTLPVLCMIVAALTWAMVGRALRPVETIRRSVDEISSGALHRRVPETPDADGDEIARLSHTMNRMLDRLEAAQEKQRRFTSDASHELRSPVAAIRQHAEVALAHPEHTSVPELARTVLNENLRVQRLVEDLLFLARADEHSLRLANEPLDLDDLVFAEARKLRQTTTLRVDTTAVSAGRIVGDIAGLRRVLGNLGDNAARHASSTITFSLAQTPAGVQLTVDDDGHGIPAEERERVLQRFVRLDSARERDAGGSGLGLAIVAELISAHNGTLKVESNPAGGARLRLTFPPDPEDAPIHNSFPDNPAHRIT